MKQFSENEEDVLLGILEKYEQELMGFKGVHYVDVGYKFIKGEQTDKLAIRVHVHEKKPESALEPSEMIRRDIRRDSYRRDPEQACARARPSSPL